MENDDQVDDPHRIYWLTQPSSLPRSVKMRAQIVVGQYADSLNRLERAVKQYIKEYQKHQAADHFKKNMQYMMGTHFVADSTITEKILTQNRGRKAKDRPVEKVKKQQSEGTVFTEEDFKRFEREYFGRAGTI